MLKTCEEIVAAFERIQAEITQEVLVSGEFLPPMSEDLARLHQLPWDPAKAELARITSVEFDEFFCRNYVNNPLVAQWSNSYPTAHQRTEMMIDMVVQRYRSVIRMSLN